MANPDQLSTNDPLMFKEQEITYNSLNRVDYFRLDNNELRFDYRPDTTKWRTRYYEDDQLQYTKYHFGNHEKIEYANGTTKNLFYIFGGKELTGIYTDTNGNGQMGYAITDHLGSIWALVNESGGFIEKYSYDPWGRRVNPDDWSLADNRNTFVTDRGFTLHEHYDQMQIINMVARLYDPLTGQFISVDPMADRYPGWGAYVYCLNNPLEYIDPDGEQVSKKVSNNNKNYDRVVTFTYDIDVKNSSNNFSDQEVMNMANEIGEQIVSSLRGYEKESNTYYKSEVNMTINNDAGTGDFYFDFVNEVTDSEGNHLEASGQAQTIGDYKENRFQVAVPGTEFKGAYSAVTEERIPRTGAHEVGHGVGLRHQKVYDDKNTLNIGSWNLMTVYGQNGNYVNIDQLEWLDEFIEEENEEDEFKKILENGN